MSSKKTVFRRHIRGQKTSIRAELKKLTGPKGKVVESLEDDQETTTG